MALLSRSGHWLGLGCAGIARQDDREPRARPEAAVDRDRAVVHVDDRADDRQSEAAAAATRLVGARAPIEPLEDPWQLARVDADARVRHVDPRAVAMGAEGDRCL